MALMRQKVNLILCYKMHTPVTITPINRYGGYLSLWVYAKIEKICLQQRFTAAKHHAATRRFEIDIVLTKNANEIVLGIVFSLRIFIIANPVGTISAFERTTEESNQCGYPCAVRCHSQSGYVLESIPNPKERFSPSKI